VTGRGAEHLLHRVRFAKFMLPHSAQSQSPFLRVWPLAFCRSSQARRFLSSSRWSSRSRDQPLDRGIGVSSLRGHRPVSFGRIDGVDVASSKSPDSDDAPRLELPPQCLDVFDAKPPELLEHNVLPVDLDALIGRECHVVHFT
jgi:hypothetical protein